MRENLGDITFMEAYHRCGRIINITVSSNTTYEMPQLLNYITAPNVLIWSAVYLLWDFIYYRAASCALPFVYRSAPLMAKVKNIPHPVPWNPSDAHFEDGSIQG